MASKLERISALSTETTQHLTDTPETWMRFLDSAARYQTHRKWCCGRSNAPCGRSNRKIAHLQSKSKSNRIKLKKKKGVKKMELTYTQVSIKIAPDRCSCVRKRVRLARTYTAPRSGGTVSAIMPAHNTSRREKWDRRNRHGCVGCGTILYSFLRVVIVSR